MNVSKRTIGRLLDTYILASVEQRITDTVIHAKENPESLLFTILNNVTDEQLRSCLPYVVELCIERCIITLNRRFTTNSYQIIDLVKELNLANSFRTEVVRKIDRVTNKDDLSYSAKTYQEVSMSRTLAIIADDYVSSFAKLQLNLEDKELQIRVKALADYLTKILEESSEPNLAIELMNLTIAAMTCFLVHEFSLAKEDESDVIQALANIIASNQLRKEAMTEINQRKK